MRPLDASNEAWRRRLAPLIELGRSVPRRDLSPDDDALACDELLDALAKKRALPAKKRPWMVLIAAALVVAAAVLWWSRAQPLRYSVEGAGADGTFVQGGATIRFEEGSVVVLDRGSRARVASVSARGASLVLENGEAHVSVHHLPGARWSVEAGPFQVAVVGTKFDITWWGSALDLVLYEGAVTVHGAVPGGALSLEGGQELVARANGEIIVHPIGVEPVTSATLPVPSASPSASSPMPSASAAASSSAKPKLSWSAMAAGGDFKSVMDDADRMGIDSVLASSSLDDLVALSDAARYTRRPDVSRKALLAERTRFAGTGAATSAAFFLGRLSEDSLGQVGDAISFYDQYLGEAPQGAFAAEARGRKMIALQRSHSAAAIPAAKAYLEQSPDGPYAAAARAMIDEK